ncbi:hypothetical protein L6164_026651 [Bauhinia variegata]|uniref:Uncharacterized protein n=1 Tax=Bauhinia variegata TaxID=167791 RepID=A0ACB9LR26_BAUVA|nr:hypothetical protein L6164_026651 [Bauhinia variegata]
MLKSLGRLTMALSPPLLPFSLKHSCPCNVSFSSIEALNLSSSRLLGVGCAARRRPRSEDDDEDEDDEYGHNEQIAQLEEYSQSARGEALLVHAVVDEEDVDVLIFKGFSSCLSYRTSPDPAKSVLPARALIKSIDRIKGPFDPSNIEYLDKGLTWETFKNQFSL